jgi:lon-related putative ATP-dependent protease
MVKELTYEDYRKKCDPDLINCETTAEMTPLEKIIGQDRAVKALRFGLEISQPGFNIYACGYPGTGRMTAVKDFLVVEAKKKPVPSDWCYVNNFDNQYQPKAIRLPPGKGKIFQNEMSNLITEVKRLLPKSFESEDFVEKRETTLKAIEEEKNKLFSELNAKAQKEGFAIQSSSIGLLVIPVVKGKPLNEREFMTLSPKIKGEIQKRREKVDSKLRIIMRQIKTLDGKIREEIEKLNREVAIYSFGNLLDDLKEKYNDFPEIIHYLDQVKKDILNNLTSFLKPKVSAAPEAAIPWLKKTPSRKYEVNVIVDNSNILSGPVILELNPTYQNLFGRMEKEAQFGMLTTDFTMIQGGALHKANGGFLVLPMEELLKNVFSWEGLKSALKNRRIEIEEVGERLGFITIKGLKPEPIPLSVKVILIGRPLLYQILYAYDLDFKELFKVKADFDITMSRTEKNMEKYAALVCTICKKEKMKHMNSSAVAKVIEHGSRLAEDQNKLSTKFADIADIIKEACFYADQDKTNLVTEKHILKAIEEKLYRSNLIQEKIEEMIQRRFLLIDTQGESVGQINGLSVISLGDFSFGRPSRVTVSMGMGKEGVIDIERESKLGGPIHTKGVMILEGYLNTKYAQEKPLSLSARLVFEQSYSGVEGDSASSTELYALLSALSGIPIKQNIAVTGSVNQKGEVQAIGGVNEKIEGFFEVCKVTGLTGQQGVIIPKANIQNLMLKEEVVETAKAGNFHIFPIENIDQGIEILTGVKAGIKGSNGSFEIGTIHYKVDKRLREMAEKIKEFPDYFRSKIKTK